MINLNIMSYGKGLLMYVLKFWCFRIQRRFSLNEIPKSPNPAISIYLMAFKISSLMGSMAGPK
jgi:hypothetical protein